MATYVDYTYYTDTYLGTAIASADFAAWALRASATIDRLTFNRAAAIITADTDATKVTAIKMATCAVAETLQSQAGTPDGTIASESVGRHSVTYVEGSTKSKERAQSDAANLYLASTGLMYRGFYAGEYSGTTASED